MSDTHESERDDAALRAAGFDPGASPAEAVARLRELQGAPGVSDAAIARALGGLAHPDAASTLAEMEARATGALRREIRRALFRLKQRGVVPPTIAAEARRPAPAARADDSGLVGYLTPVDPEGFRIVWIVKPRPQGGYARLWALVSDDEGLLRVGVQPVARRELKAELADVERRSGAKFIEADWRLADYIICEAYRCTPEPSRGRVGGFLAVRAEVIASPPPATFEHPVYAELGEEIPPEPTSDLLTVPEIGAWRLPEAVVKPYVEEIRRVGESLIVVSPAQQQERVGQTMERALDELFGGEHGARMRRRFEDAAYYLLKTGRRREAALAASAARMIRDRAELRRNAFFQSFTRNQLGARVAEEREQQRAEPRLIMTPAEAMRAQQARRRR